ncbi:hypothetical protein BU14_0223s0002 [Porphyra umbilicalis]|uniref:Uncharacterized protein n=1 Tax=Porphyra umbilicalis TaxID=2786 RepID=A0A1X6P4B2_PORUM|nr:hypothetical protein BU14_0223s0002 [Porphyra umbilicalis]|eukprot:OSX75729.1 hypothetical protein BU14_0223s0002 [Porphyra umbilicalis]
MVADVVAGLSASAAAIGVTYPLDTLRTRAQASLLSTTVPTTQLAAGWTSAAAGAVATSTAKVLVRTATGGALPALSSLVASAVGVPFDVAKTRAQAGVGPPKAAAAAAANGLVARCSAALPGWTATLARDVPFAAVEVVGLLALRAVLVHRAASSRRQAAASSTGAGGAGAAAPASGLRPPAAGGLFGPPAGAASGWGMVAGGVAVTAAAAAITTPLDVIKTQLMAAKRPGGTWRSVGKRTVDVARKKAGVRILFKGVGPRTAAAALAPLVFLGVFGAVRRTVGGRWGGARPAPPARGGCTRARRRRRPRRRQRRPCGRRWSRQGRSGAARR